MSVDEVYNALHEVFAFPGLAGPLYERQTVPALTLLLKVSVPDAILPPVFLVSELRSAKALVTVKKLRRPSTTKLSSTFFKCQDFERVPDECQARRMGPAVLTGRCAR
jgi:hypothetical protein